MARWCRRRHRTRARSVSSPDRSTTGRAGGTSRPRMLMIRASRRCSPRSTMSTTCSSVPSSLRSGSAVPIVGKRCSPTCCGSSRRSSPAPCLRPKRTVPREASRADSPTARPVRQRTAQLERAWRELGTADHDADRRGIVVAGDRRASGRGASNRRFRSGRRVRSVGTTARRFEPQRSACDRRRDGRRRTRRDCDRYSNAPCSTPMRGFGGRRSSGWSRSASMQSRDAITPLANDTDFRVTARNHPRTARRSPKLTL